MTVHRVPMWALPSELAEFDGGPSGRRTVRDWAADAGLFCVAALWWLWGYSDYIVDPDPAYLALVDDWTHAADPWVGAAACLAVWWRRRFPLALGVTMVAVLFVSSTATGAALVAVFTVAVHRRWLPATLVAVAMLAQGMWFSLIYQPDNLPVPVFLAYVLMMFLAPLGWGMMVRFRRQLLVSLRRDTQREREQHGRRLAAARRAERERIAREMHDVLAHRISLLSVHAGALAYRTAQAAAGQGRAMAGEEMAETAGVIRDNAHQALTELGEVLSVLRAKNDPAHGDGRDAPQPLLADLPRLVEEARSAGQRVTLEVDGVLSADPSPRPQEQRTVYRIVQEGLTNARKHAPTAPVWVRVEGSPGAGLDVRVANPLPARASRRAVPGAGAGITGLAERVALDGGTLSHGQVDGAFQLAAHLPWRST